MAIDLDDLDALESAARRMETAESYTDCFTATVEFDALTNPAAILELIAELRQARAERDWLAKNLLLARAREFSRKRCPSREHWYQFDLEKDTDYCIACWIKAASEAVEGKK